MGGHPCTARWAGGFSAGMLETPGLAGRGGSTASRVQVPTAGSESTRPFQGDGWAVAIVTASPAQPPPTSTPPSQLLLPVFLNAGPNCQTNINECASNPCLNQGTCIDDVAGYTCNCLLPYTGKGGAPRAPQLCGAAASAVTPNQSFCMCNEPAPSAEASPCTALPWGCPRPRLHLPVLQRSLRKF